MFLSGAIKDIEAFFGAVEKPLMADFGPMLAKVRVEFSDALGNLATEEYATAKTILEKAWTSAQAAHPGNLSGAVAAAMSNAKSQLATAGIQVAEKAVVGLLSAVITSAL